MNNLLFKIYRFEISIAINKVKKEEEELKTYMIFSLLLCLALKKMGTNENPNIS